jgi:hypothetical protein
MPADRPLHQVGLGGNNRDVTSLEENPSDQ